ncbi:flagellin [Rubrivirga marina]|uniref:Flagellin n=1 Tax=Rubrivirga marina TaxID=1196024 RepID=A0A271IXD4_9BACT|nr:flagellin [Rubrivirga marina]PAP75780.1 hypothetical protein BSZ37_04655 [Rubrivirga marina]
MSFRINTNTQSALALSSLNKTTSEIGSRQLRLATGSRINSAADDSAGFTISNKLQATTRGQAQALGNIGDAKSMLTVAEGALGSTMDILQTMKEKAVQAGNSSMGDEERAAIQSQVAALGAEVSDILGGANFNGTKLFTNDAAGTDLSFQVGDKSGDTFSTTIGRTSVSSLGIGTVATTTTPAADAVATVSSVSDDGDGTAITTGGFTLGGAYSGTEDKVIEFTVDGSDLTYQDEDGRTQTISIADANNEAKGGFEGVTIEVDTNATSGDKFTLNLTAKTEAVTEGDFTSSLDLTSDSGVADALTTIDAAISSISRTASSLGDVQNRLDFKAQNLETSKTNYEAANSRIADADFAKEQMEIVKLQILQQTGSAMFAQSNASGQSVLSFF